MEEIKVENLTFTYPGARTPALDGVNLTVRAGEFIVVTGLSGSGKSTLLRHFKPALIPVGELCGTVTWDGAPLLKLTQREQAELIGFVAQNPEGQTVTDKVWHELAFSLESLGYKTPEIRRKVAEIAGYFGIEPWFYHPVEELSGGQKQIVNLAAAMLTNPPLLILDEPTSQLDPIAASNLIDIVTRITREMGTTVIMTEHRLEEVFPLCDRAVVLDAGRIAAVGTPREVGAYLGGNSHGFYLSLPTPARVYAAADGGADPPLTVREGREWLAAFGKEHDFAAIPPEKNRSRAPDAVPALALYDVWFRYEKDTPDILRGLTLEAYAGEFLAVMGGNGAGKTTALSVMAGTLRPYRGKTALGSGETALLPQDASLLFLHNTVYEDLCEMVADAENRPEAVDAVSRRCGITNLLDTHFFDLSGGERQRAALAKLLLRTPRVLLLDEPTKGMDGNFKAQFAEILEGLTRDGVCVVMVSHDIEFCAKYAHRLALFFDGAVVSEGTPRGFFTGNNFYTTAANRMARGLLPDALVDTDIIEACGGAEPPRNAREYPVSAAPAKTVAVKPAPYKKPPASRAAILLIPLTLTVIILTVVFGGAVFRERGYYVISCLVFVEAAVPLLGIQGRRKPGARELVITAVLCAVAAGGRLAFYMVPGFKPIAAVVIIAGIAMGPWTGFVTGAVSMFTSNFFFGQGPWTPWQMLAMGLVGLFAGALFYKSLKPLPKLPVCIYGAVVTVVVYGGIVNISSVLLFQPEPNLQMFAAAILAALPLDAVHAAATVFFLITCLNPFVGKIERIRIKYGI